jgi:hypothetical protein
MNKAQRTPIAALVRHQDYQVRADINQETVDRYANVLRAHPDALSRDLNGDPDGPSPLPPIKVANVNGALVVVDGWHRIAAHEQLGVLDIEAELVGEMSEQNARWAAARANMQHGLPLKRKELRAAFGAFVKAGQHIIRDPKGRTYANRFKSYAQITTDFGGMVARTTLQRWMLKDFPKIARAIGEGSSGHSAEPPGGDGPEAVSLRRTLEAVAQAQANAHGVHKPDNRGQIVRALEGALQAAKAGGEWWLPEF